MSNLDNLNTLYLGTFNSEFFWRDEGYSELPSIPDLQSDNVLSVIDELQFVFCNNPNDVLITRLPIDEFHREYLTDLGFKFKGNNVQLANGDCENNSINASICKLIAEHRNIGHFSNLTSSLSKFSPYSILPDSSMLLKKIGLEDGIPDVEIVRKVNSKVFSTILSKQLRNEKKEEVVYSADELLMAGKKMIASSQVLIKDPMGVSGKGNMLINSEKLLTRIRDHIKKQESKGKKTCFVLESLLNKKTDFSCQLFINKTGDIKFVTIQVMQNKAFAFSGIQTADDSFYNFLDKTEYFKQVEWIGREMYKEGYFGPVCIDSMIDQEDNIIPIIEINARKSMGLINFYLDQYLAKFFRKGNLMYLSLILKNKLPFDSLIKKLDESGILFSNINSSGILPLSANAININVKENVTETQSFKGRFYFSSIAKDGEEERNEIMKNLNNVLNEFNIKVVN